MVGKKGVYSDAGYRGIEKRAEIAGDSSTLRVAMRHGKRRVLAGNTRRQVAGFSRGRKAQIRAKEEHPFHVIKQQFGFQKTILHAMAKSLCKVNVLAALTNLHLDRAYLLATR
jgi:IS5 family transposase